MIKNNRKMSYKGGDEIKGFDDLWTAYYAIIEFMCSTGWEPFATGEENYGCIVHLRRNSQ